MYAQQKINSTLFTHSWEQGMDENRLFLLDHDLVEGHYPIIGFLNLRVILAC